MVRRRPSHPAGTQNDVVLRHLMKAGIVATEREDAMMTMVCLLLIRHYHTRDGESLMQTEFMYTVDVAVVLSAERAYVLLSIICLCAICLA